MKRASLLVCLLVFCSLTLLGQIGKSPRSSYTKEKSAIHVPPQETPAALKTIYSNLKSKTDLYNDTRGWVISGPKSGYFFTQFNGMPFTPKSDSTVTQVQVAVQYSGGGANQVNLSIYTDASGAPGTLLAGPVTVTNAPPTGTCCTLAVANFSPVAVTGGTQYWVVADTPLTGTGSDFEGVWDYVAEPVYPQASNRGSGWSEVIGSPGESAGKVLGTIP